MLNAFDPDLIVEHVASKTTHLPPEQQVVFLLGPLDVFARLELDQEHKEFGEKNPSLFALSYVRRSLRGWRNLRTRGGLDAPCIKGADGYLTRESFKRIGSDFDLYFELFTKAIALNSAEVEQVEKS